MTNPMKVLRPLPPRSNNSGNRRYTQLTVEDLQLLYTTFINYCESLDDVRVARVETALKEMWEKLLDSERPAICLAYAVVPKQGRKAPVQQTNE